MDGGRIHGQRQNPWAEAESIVHPEYERAPCIKLDAGCDWQCSVNVRFNQARVLSTSDLDVTLVRDITP